MQVPASSSVQLKYIDDKDRDRWPDKGIANNKQKTKRKQTAHHKSTDKEQMTEL